MNSSHGAHNSTICHFSLICKKSLPTPPSSPFQYLHETNKFQFSVYEIDIQECTEDIYCQISLK